jgi:RNA polymerase sigma-70 factor (ECF subfamily)
MQVPGGLLAEMIDASRPVRLPDPSLWVDRYGDVLFRYALLRVRNREVAEDLVQETFLAALTARKHFQGRSTVKTWFIGVLKRKIVDHIRRECRHAPVQEPDPSVKLMQQLFDQKGKWRVGPTDWGQDPSNELETKEFWEVFQRCLAKLPRKLSDAFTLREMEELSSKEVRKVLQVSANNLWVLLHRARIRLVRCLDVNWFRHTEG